MQPLPSRLILPDPLHQIPFLPLYTPIFDCYLHELRARFMARTRLSVTAVGDGVYAVQYTPIWKRSRISYEPTR